MKLSKETSYAIVLLVASIAISMVLSEWVLRSFFVDQLAIQSDERASLYRYDEILGWFPKPNLEETLLWGNEISIRSNSRGYRDAEHEFTREKKRLLVLGDSFVWGFNVEEEDRFTELLADSLEHWEVYNLGVSGYGTGQEYMLLQKEIDYYQPDLVLLVYTSSNDRLDTIRNKRYSYYYKSFFEVADDSSLVLSGIPIPKGEKYFLNEHPALASSYLLRLGIRSYYNVVHPLRESEKDPTSLLLKAMAELSKSKNSNFIIGLQAKSSQVIETAYYNEIPVLDFENPHFFKFAGGHWNPEGHKFVADKISAYINTNYSE